MRHPARLHNLAGCFTRGFSLLNAQGLEIRVIGQKFSIRRIALPISLFGMQGNDRAQRHLQPSICSGPCRRRILSSVFRRSPRRMRCRGCDLFPTSTTRCRNHRISLSTRSATVTASAAVPLGCSSALIWEHVPRSGKLAISVLSVCFALSYSRVPRVRIPSLAV